MKHLKPGKNYVLTVMLLAIVYVVSITEVAATLDQYGLRKNFKLSSSAIQQFDTNLDNYGDFSVSRYFFRIDWNKKMSDAFHTGISLHYNLNDYSFSKSSALRRLKELEDLHSLGLGTRIMYLIGEDWRIVIIPSIEFSGESGSDTGISLIYGGILSAGYRVSPDLTIGAGIGIFSRFEEVSYFPMIVINWKINDRLRLSNPFSGGPTGPAGLELSCNLDKGWEIAFGGAYRSLRFRLNDEDTTRDGIFQEKAIPVWGRVTLRSGTEFKIDLNAGAFLSGNLEMKNEDGHDISKDRYDAAPFVALTVSLLF